MILCSAIKYYIESTKKEVILCARRHPDIIKQLKYLGFQPGKGYKIICQGFLNDKGKFLDRYEAYEEAKNCNQIIDIALSNKDMGLFSEDLWK